MGLLLCVILLRCVTYVVVASDIKTKCTEIKLDIDEWVLVNPYGLGFEKDCTKLY